jgi:hypothetical protein
MNLKHCVDRFIDNMKVIEGLTRNLSEEQARWKPSPDKWSILEVVNHLRDEEVEDFRTRLNLLINDPHQTWPPIDPPKWAIEREYNKRQLNQSINEFLREREESILWLKGLSSSDWSTSYNHPQGKISAGDLLASWIAHDYLHIRQLTRLHYEYLAQEAAPYSSAYAGTW